MSAEVGTLHLATTKPWHRSFPTFATSVHADDVNIRCCRSPPTQAKAQLKALRDALQGRGTVQACFELEQAAEAVSKGGDGAETLGPGGVLRSRRDISQWHPMQLVLSCCLHSLTMPTQKLVMQ